ncbi:hypothetical protein HN014_10825 [Aquimarina sp. TRL1]|uniref:hypothetical protein n=1 Tax=Aquimarina sp. (strain TRL1) TaxID=2736252 RepID=UPI0015898BFA|nr:hypothetical protein [Aquimarina sp. TRL1]QKX05386.1 hypothetical protein HN014_10825 [Aquimarina sp. TRL1]
MLRHINMQWYGIILLLFICCTQQKQTDSKKESIGIDPYYTNWQQVVSIEILQKRDPVFTLSKEQILSLTETSSVSEFLLLPGILDTNVYLKMVAIDSNGTFLAEEWAKLTDMDSQNIIELLEKTKKQDSISLSLTTHKKRWIQQQKTALKNEIAYSLSKDLLGDTITLLKEGCYISWGIAKNRMLTLILSPMSDTTDFNIVKEIPPIRGAIKLHKGYYRFTRESLEQFKYRLSNKDNPLYN